MITSVLGLFAFIVYFVLKRFQNEMRFARLLLHEYNCSKRTKSTRDSANGIPHF